MEPLPHKTAETRVSMASLPHEIVQPMVSVSHLPLEIQHKILKGLNVSDLIRCKSVCKSWLSLISDPVFIKDHLNHQHDKDHNDERFGDRRITMSKQADYILCQIEGPYINDDHLLGSSNGLVCVSPSPLEVLVINPSSREVKKVTKPLIPETNSLCWGFGYDSINDDYKIVLGFKKGDKCTCFQMFSLRSNIWKVIAEINHVFTSRVGILSEGALHWLAYDTSPEKKNVILTFHLSGEKFLEVSTPNDARYNELYTFEPLLMRLGTTDGRLCVFEHGFEFEIWVMNKERSWEKFGSELKMKYDAVHMIKQLKNYIPNKRPLCHRVWANDYCLWKSRVFFGTPIFVESLVSPHFHEKPQKKRRATSTIKSSKVKANRHAIFDACENAGTSSRVKN